ncbi:hypothetical protein M885DRAFT_248047 [Pelagophyceae sp. CCMP2097]|nr:hypothetical protein M885DRAFT_248047 [Pelagophyceae sp. CCMP2097]
MSQLDDAPQRSSTAASRRQMRQGLRRRGAKTSLQRRQRRAHLQREPWWWKRMQAHGLCPDGLQADDLLGYPVILPSRQCVYILPTARNAHLARTYAPRGDDASAPSGDMLGDDSDSETAASRSLDGSDDVASARGYNTYTVVPDSYTVVSDDASDLEASDDECDDECESWACALDFTFLDDEEVAATAQHGASGALQSTPAALPAASASAPRASARNTARSARPQPSAADVAARAIRRAQHEARRARNERKHGRREQRCNVVVEDDGFDALLAEHLRSVNASAQRIPARA